MKEKKFSIRSIILVGIFMIMAFMIYNVCVNYYVNNIDILNFCKEHYEDESFMDKFVDSDPYVLKECYGKGGEFKIHFSDYRNYCPNITDEEWKFSRSCHWMGSDYFVLMVKVLGFVGTLMFGGIAFGVLSSTFKKEESKK